MREVALESLGLVVNHTVVEERKKEKTLRLYRNTCWRSSLSGSM
jgi:hypothetical protein